jgi:predicted nucleotidyltransferase component of viral defense system
LINRAHISEWSHKAPWPQMYQVEQDLVISRALINIFEHPELAKHLAFRGGTALFKLHLPAARYSEDIDLVQVEAGKIGPLLDILREQLKWLGAPRWESSPSIGTLTYRFTSEEEIPLKLKVEINTREHFSELGLQRLPFSMESRWFTGSAEIQTYHLNELLGTKVRALYQRKKGRDLFDLWKALLEAKVDPAVIINCFLRYMEHEGHKVSRAEFEMNLAEKASDRRFSEDIHPLLAPGSEWDFDKAMEAVMGNLVALLPGDKWQGGKKSGEAVEQKGSIAGSDAPVAVPAI